MFSWDLLMQFQVYIQFLSMIDRKKPQPMFLKMKDEMVTVPKWCIVSKFRSRYVVFRNHTLDHLKFFQAKKSTKVTTKGSGLIIGGGGRGTLSRHS